MPHDNVIPFPGVFGHDLEPPTLKGRRVEAATFVLRVELDDTEPPVWRRLRAPSDVTLAAMHDVLQLAMGWTDSHLHHFQIDDDTAPFLTDFDIEEGDEGVAEADVRLDEVVAEVGDAVVYAYDFGDGWRHTAVLEAIEAYDGSAARLVDGQRACPPENCGGITGYHDIVEQLAANRLDPQMADWLPVGWSPEAFDLEETNASVALALSGSLRAVEPDAVTAPLSDLVRVSPPSATAPLSRMLAAAALGDEELPSAEERRRQVWWWLRLLDVVGDGVTLTGAGYLKPALVAQLATEMDLPKWIGKNNREEHCRPIAWLRNSATALGLVRKRKGELLPTALGLKVRGNPELVWARLVESLPLGRQDFERQAGAIALLAVAAGKAPYETLSAHGADVVEAAGWTTDGGGIEGWEVYRWTRPTTEALEVAGICPTWRRDTAPDEAARRLARAALRTR